MAPPHRGGHGLQGHLRRSREHGRRDAVGGVDRNPCGAVAGDRRLCQEVSAQALLLLPLHPCVSEAASDEADGVERAQRELVLEAVGTADKQRLWTPKISRRGITSAAAPCFTFRRSPKPLIPTPTLTRSSLPQARCIDY